MKTTVDIADSVLEEAKQLAASRSITLRELVEDGLRKVLAEPRNIPFRLRDGSVGGKGMVRKMSWEEIRDEIYRGRGA